MYNYIDAAFPKSFSFDRSGFTVDCCVPLRKFLDYVADGRTASEHKNVAVTKRGIYKYGVGCGTVERCY